MTMMRSTFLLLAAIALPAAAQQIQLPAGLLVPSASTLQGVAGTATAITYTVDGVEQQSSTPFPKQLGQGQLPTSAAAIYTPTSGFIGYVTSITLNNATGSDVSGVTLYVGGSAAANSILGPLTIKTHGACTWVTGGAWTCTDGNGAAQFAGATSLSAGTGLNISGGVISLTVPVVVSSGGTGNTTLTAHGLLLGEGTSATAAAGPGSSAQLLFAQGASADPSFASMSQDCTVTAAGVITCTKTNNVSFAPSATTDTTNASNISTGTLAAARGGAGTVSGILKANGAGVVSAAVSATDYAPATTGSSLLLGSSGGFASYAGATATANSFVTSISAAGATTVVRPACADLSDSASGCNNATTTLGAFSSTPSSGGLTLSAGKVLNMDPADLNNPGGVSTTTQTFAGAKTFSNNAITFGTGTSQILAMLNGGAGTNRFVQFKSGGVSRWATGANSAAESGSDAGSTYVLTALTDAGTTIDSPISIVRAAGGAMTFSRALVATAGLFTFTNVAAPASPSAGTDTYYIDSTDLRFHDKNASGVIGTTVVADTGASNNFLTAVSAAGAISKAQPSFSNLSGSATCAQQPALTGAVTTSAGSCATTAAAIPTTALTGALQAAQEPAHTGDVTNSAGSLALALANIPSGTPMAGSVLATNVAAPATPAAGKTSVYVDSTSKVWAAKNDAGTVSHGVQTQAAVANNYVTAIADTGAVSTARPTCSNLSDAGSGCTATVSGTNTGDVTLGAVGAVPNGNAASLSGQALTLQPADASNPGVLLAGAQTLGASKVFTSPFSIGTGTGAVTGMVNGGAGTNRGIQFQSGGVNRWVINTNSIAESGSDAGSNFNLNADNDSGTFIDNVIAVQRAAGSTFAISRPISEQGTLLSSKYVPQTRNVNTTAPITGGGALSSDLTLALTTSPTGQTPVGVTRTITATAPITIDGTTSANLSADRTIAISPASSSAAGSLSAAYYSFITAYKDATIVLVTSNAYANIACDGSTDDATAWNTITANAPARSVLLMPPCTSVIKSAITTTKHFTFHGAGIDKSIIQSNVGAADFLTLGDWYTNIEGISFNGLNTTVTSAVALSGVGVSLLVGSTTGFPASGTFYVQTNLGWTLATYTSIVDSTHFGGVTAAASTTVAGGALTVKTGGQAVDAGSMNHIFLRDVGFAYVYDGFESNGTICGIMDSNIANEVNFGIHFNGINVNSIVHNVTADGAPPALAHIEVNQAGSLLISDSDLIRAQTNLRLNPTSPNGVFGVYAVNTYFDTATAVSGTANSGNGVLLQGTGNIQRIKFINDWMSSASHSGLWANSTAATLPTDLEISGDNIYSNGVDGLQLDTVQDFIVSGNQISGNATAGVALLPGASAVTNGNIVNNQIGPAGGIGANGTGLVVGAGTYGNLSVIGNDLSGNTTAAQTGFPPTITAPNMGIMALNQGTFVCPPDQAPALSLPLTTVTQAGTSCTMRPGARVGSWARITVTLHHTASIATLTPTLHYGTANTSADASLLAVTTAAGTAAVGSCQAIFEFDVASATTANVTYRWVNGNNAATGCGGASLQQGATAPVTITNINTQAFLGVYFASTLGAVNIVDEVKYEYGQ